MSISIPKFASVILGTTIRVICLCVATVSAWPQTMEAGIPRCPDADSTYPQMAFDEDNRYLKDSECRTERADRLKFIPLRSENENYYLSFGASIRQRGEYFSNPDWGDGPPGSSYLLQRYYLHSDLHWGERFRLFGELMSALESGRNGGPRPVVDENKLDIHQAFVDVRLWQSGKNSLTLRTGRQEMAFGSNSLISSRDGRNVRRSFDGFRLTGSMDKWTIDTFAVRQSESNPGIFDDSIDHTTSFWGLYAVRPFKILPGGHADLYYLGQGNKNATYVKGSGREQRETIGTRLWGSTEHWDYNYESTLQWGRFGTGNIRAWAIFTQTDYRLESVRFHPRFGIKADTFSGDDNPSSHTLGTFNALYELGPYFSYAELFGKRNLIDLQPSVRLDLNRKISLTPNVGLYWRESTTDGLYVVATSDIVVAGRESGARYVGSHAATQLKWNVNRHTTFFAEYSHFFPGAFLRQSTRGRNINYVTEWIEFRF